MLTTIAAIACISTRALLNVSDRCIFRRSETQVCTTLLLNAVLPLLVAIGVGLSYGCNGAYTFAVLMSPASLFAAIGAQGAAIVFSLSFKEMNVRNVAVSSKLADLFIPLGIFVLTLNFSPLAYLYSVLTVLVFAPMFLAMRKSKGDIKPKMILLVIGTLLFQAVVNDLFHTREWTQDWLSFLSFMVAVLFWRTILMLVPVLWNCRHQSLKLEWRGTGILALRAVIAFVSQAAFFYAITRPDNSVVWPLINGTPLASCYTAHVILGEPMARADLASFGLFCTLTLTQIITQWS